MTNVFGRVSTSWDKVSEVFSDIKCTGMVVYQHLQDAEVSRTHIHFYIEECHITVEGIKKKVRKAWSDITKSDWAFNTKDVNRSCITYMSKGELQPIYNTSTIDTEEYRLLWEDKQPKGRMYQTKLQYIVRETAGDAKKRKNDLIEEMIGELGSNDCHHSKLHTNAEYDEQIIKAIIKVLNDNKVVFSRYSIRDYYDTILARTQKETFVRQMILFCGYRT